MASTQFADLSWDEAERQLAETPVIVLPVGASLKEHGFHLPLSTDSRLADYLGAAVAERADVTLLPTLGWGYYPAFRAYAGSVSLESETFTRVLCETVLSFRPFTSAPFYVLNTGISTLWSLEPARQRLQGAGCRMEYTDLKAALGELEQDLCEQERGSHADEIETSMMMVIAPEQVRIDRAVRDDQPRRGPGPFSRDPNITSGIYSASGAWGDPTLATREKGEAALERLLAWIEHDIRTLTDPEAPIPPPRSEYLD